MAPVETGASGIDGAKLAVTVLMIRDAPDGIEVYVQERVSTMPTFPNTTVFPGGGVDPRDFETGDFQGMRSLIAGASLSRWAKALHADEARARALLFAAVRELFEETGTLLAVHKDGTPVTDATAYHPQRLALESHRHSLTQMLSNNELKIRSDLLRPFARWVSLPEDPYHFDVFSFVAVAPYGQEPDGNTREAASSGWFPPSLILDGWRAGLLRLVIPTWAQLTKLSKFDSVEEVMNALRTADMTPHYGRITEDPDFAQFHNHVPPKRF